MNIDELTLGQLKQIQKLCSTNKCESKWKIGQAYFIRTVTNYYTGILEYIDDHELYLSKAAWIADTGRYYDALKYGEFSEVEPIIGPCFIGRGSLIDAVEWPNKLPDKQK